MNKKRNGRTILIKGLKIFGWVFLSLFTLLIVVILLLRLPAVQNRIVQYAVNFLEDKIGTEVRLENLYLAFPKKIVLKGLYLEDQTQDTLLYAGKLAIDTDLWKLTKNTIELNQIELTNLRAYVSRPERDSAYNFSYIIDSFANSTAAPDTTSTSSWKFKLGNVNLEDIGVHYVDSLSGNFVHLNLGTFQLSTDEFDLERAIYHADEIQLSDVQASVIQTGTPAPPPASPADDPSDTASTSYDISFNRITLANIQSHYQSASGQDARVDIGDIQVQADEIDLAQKLVELQDVSIRDTKISYQQYAQADQPQPDTVSTVGTDSSAAWTFSLDRLALENNNIQYHNHQFPIEKGFDPNHIWLIDLDVLVTDVAYSSEGIAAHVQEFSLKERGGFVLETFQGNFAVRDNGMEVRDFLLETPYSDIRLDVYADYASLEGIASQYPQANVSLDLKPSRLALRELAFFQPALLQQMPLANPNDVQISFQASAQGQVNDLTIHSLLIQVLNNTSLSAKGRIKGLPDVENAIVDIELQRLYTTRKDIQTALKAGMLPASVQLPEWMSLRATLDGTMKTPDIRAALRTSLGELVAQAELNLRKETYKGRIQIRELNVGTLLNQPETMGNLNMRLSADGEGLSMETVNAKVNAVVNEFVYNGYSYKNLTLDGRLTRQFYEGTIALADENANFTLKADLDYRDNVPVYKAELDLKNLDFKALNLSERPLRLRSTLNVDLATPDFKQVNGNIALRKVAVFNGEDLYTVDSLLVASIDQVGESEIAIDSDILTGKFQGTINIFSLPQVLNRHINRYIALSPPAEEKSNDVQRFTFSLEIHDTDLITEVLVPELDPFEPGEIAGSFDSETAEMDVRLHLAKISYSGLRIDSLGFRILSDPESFDYTLLLQDVGFDTLGIHSLRFAGNILNDSIHTNLMILDSLKEEKYFLGGLLRKENDVFQFHFLPGETTLNYVLWETPPDNLLRFTPAGLDPRNFTLSHGDERITIQQENSVDSTLSVIFNSVDLSYLTNLVEGTTPASGILDGDINLGVSEKGAFNSRLTITDLHVLQQYMGDLSFALGQTATGPLNVDLRLEGEPVDLIASGFLSAGETREITMDIDINRFAVSVVQPFAAGQVSDLSGNLTGEIKIRGNTANPDMDGQLNFANVQFVPSLTGSKLTLDDESIGVNNSGLTFDNFTIQDAKQNTATLSGNIVSRPGAPFGLDLRLATDNFQVLNKEEPEDGDMFYGKMWVTAGADISGTTSLPVVQLDLSFSDETNFTYVIPQSQKEALQNQDIVVFVDRDFKDDPFLRSINPKDTISANRFGGISLTANIELTDAETFNIVIDPASGDRLSVKGNSTLTLAIDPTGDMELTGRYEISEGSYQLSFYNLVKREFSIQKGSSIVWAGNPMEGRADITAIYEVETSPIDLVSNQFTGSQVPSTYKQRLPFQVYLYIDGSLLTPEISFSLGMPEGQRNAFGGNIYAILQDINSRESDLNKQVFALLILKRFISDNPFESEAGQSVAGAARTSVSKLLTEQLNRLSQNIEGVEITFDVRSYEDYSSGQAEGQTELQLGLSKSLLDDRLVVKVAGNLDVEGNTSDQSSFTDYLGDIAVEYKLTEDGRFRITGFRTSDFDMIDGELIETGLGLIYIKDYNSLKELFRSNKKTE